MNETFLDFVMDESYCKTLTICGSYRYRKLKEEYQAYYTLKNNVVFMPINYLLIKKSVETSEESFYKNAEIMANIHDKKIDLSDGVIIVTGVNQYYIGNDTSRELCYAFKNHKFVMTTSLRPECDRNDYYFNNDPKYPLYIHKSHIIDIYKED